MSDEELLIRLDNAYEKRKAYLKEMGDGEFKDYDFGELYIRYELKEYIRMLVEDYGRDDDYRDILEYLKGKAEPLEWLYNIYGERENSLWDNTHDDIEYNMSWERRHNG